MSRPGAHSRSLISQRPNELSIPVGHRRDISLVKPHAPVNPHAPCASQRNHSMELADRIADKLRKIRNRNLELVRNLKRSGHTVVYISHIMEDVFRVADRMVVLHRGTTLQAGAPMEVMARPADVDVARLVDMKNLFPGRVEAHEPERGRTLVRWGAHVIEARHQPDFEQGPPVVWGLRAGDVILHRRDRPSRGERENPVFGPIVSYVPLGETVSIAMAAEGAEGNHPLHFSVSIHVARRNGLADGVRIGASLVADGIQIMPAD
jgi:molybdate transport system ATP-binding protein